MSIELLRRTVKPKRKANTSRKPPEPSDDHSSIENLIADSMPKVQPLATRLDEIIREVIPDAQFAVKWSKAHYGLPQLGWIIEMAAYSVSANLVFYEGADFEPPPPLGETGQSRYVKLYTLDDAEAPEVRSWIGQAATMSGWQ